MTKVLLSVEETKARIASGEALLIAGDETLLHELPKGEWIGGTIPYFIGDHGGVMTEEKLYVDALPAEMTSFNTRFYDEEHLADIVADEYEHGFSYLIIPAFTTAHKNFAKNVHDFEGVFERPLLGWIAGVALKEIGTRAPQVVDGLSGRWSATEALCLHAHLKENVAAEIGIINPFAQGDGDIITVDRSAFHITEANVNGEHVFLLDYLLSHNKDLRLPLVADYSGAMINVSFKSVDLAAKRVEFFAPLFPNIQYRLAAPLSDYWTVLSRMIAEVGQRPTLTVNCVLNYVHASLEGRHLGGFMGPMPFGEIAYVLLNQSIVYMMLKPTET